MLHHASILYLQWRIIYLVAHPRTVTLYVHFYDAPDRGLMVPDFALPSDIGALLPQDWAEVAVAFLRDIYERSHSIKSLRLYRGMLFGFLRMVKKCPDACTRNDVQAFMRSPVAAPGKKGELPTVATRNARLAILSSFWKFAAFYFERSVPNPTLGIRQLKRQRSNKKRAFTDEELARFFAAIPRDSLCGVRDFAIFSLYAWTGKRRGEICKLRFGDIEPCFFIEHGIARPAWKFRYFNKGRSEEPSYQELPSMAKAAIDRYLIKSNRLATITPGDPVFIAHGPPQGGGRRSVLPNAPLHSDTVRDNFEKYLRLAGLANEQGLSIHSFRHTAATQRYLLKPDILLLQKFLGHASIATTQLYIGDIFGQGDPLAHLLEEKYSRLGL